MKNIDLNGHLQWHIAYTLPRMEKKLEGYLKKYGFHAFVPKVKIKSRWKDRWKEIEKPLFSSYIFIYMDYWEDRNKVIVLPGIHHFVFFNGIPSIVPNEDIEILQIFVDNFSDKLNTQKNDSLKPGKNVKVKYGLFAGRTAEIVRTRNNLTSVVVRFPMIGQALKVEIPIEVLGLEEEVFLR